MNISFHKQLLILLAIASISCCTVTYSSWFNDLFKDVSWGMNIDVNQDENSVIVVINVPFNIDPENINIEIKDKILYVHGIQEEKKEIKKEDYYYSEMSSSSFNPVIGLPCVVDETATTAEITDNILTITMPKIEQEVKKKIKVVRTR